MYQVWYEELCVVLHLGLSTVLFSLMPLLSPFYNDWNWGFFIVWLLTQSFRARISNQTARLPCRNFALTTSLMDWRVSLDNCCVHYLHIFICSLCFIQCRGAIKDDIESMGEGQGVFQLGVKGKWAWYHIEGSTVKSGIILPTCSHQVLN